MAKDKEENKHRVRTGEFRLSFPYLFKTSEKTGKYQLVMLFPKNKKGKAAVKEIWEQIEDVVHSNSKWDEKQKAKVLKQAKNPDSKYAVVVDGSERDYDGYENMVAIDARNDRKPGVVDQRLNPITEADDVYAGCWCRATILPFCFDNEHGIGVRISLQNVQKLRDDEAFGNRVDAEDDFDEVDTDDDGDDEVTRDDGDDGDDDDDDGDDEPPRRNRGKGKDKGKSGGKKNPWD